MFQIIDPSQVENWDTQLAAIQDPNGTIFHTAAWARVLKDTYGHAPNYFAAWEDHKLVKVVPFMEVNSWWRGRRGIALPFTDLCDPVGVAPADFPRLLDQIGSQARARNWRCWELRGGEAGMKGIHPSLQFYTHVLDFEAGESTIFESFDSGVRRAIRKAEKSGLKAEISQSESAMEKFYSLQCRTRQKHGLPPQPWSFFQHVHRHMIEKGLGFLVLVSRNGCALAASLYFIWGRQAIYKFGASDDRFQEFRGSSLTMWRAIQHCLQLGVGSLHFGRTSLGNEGLRRYKLGWGTTEQQQSYFKFDLRSEAFAKEADRSIGWHTHVFRRMPRPLLRLAGQLLYPHLA